MIEEENSQTLRTGNYTIDISSVPSIVSKVDATTGAKTWVCTCPDPESAMIVVEGLILVENKRFYYPDSNPTMKVEESPLGAEILQENINQ